MFELDALVIRGHEKVIDLPATARHDEVWIEYQGLQRRIEEETEALTRYLRERPRVTPRAA